MARLAHLLCLPLAAAAWPALATADAVPPTNAAAPGAGVPVSIRTSLENPSGLPVGAVIAGGRLRVVGTVRPFVSGQLVFVRTYRYGRKLETRAAAVESAGTESVGRFSTLIGVGGRPGQVSVRIALPATPTQAEEVLSDVRVPVIRATLRLGQSGAAARLLQQELAALHYAVPRSGHFDDATARAVIAFRKLTGLARTDQANRIVFDRLAAGSGAFHVRFPRQGAHFEADLTHQVLAEVLSGGRVRQIFEMSSGKPSTPTVTGSFSIYLKTIGTNAKGMGDANYFIGGYAIHGYADVPVYPASHGCLRIPVPDAAAVYQWARFGYPVDTYFRNGGGSRSVRNNAGP